MLPNVLLEPASGRTCHVYRVEIEGEFVESDLHRAAVDFSFQSIAICNEYFPNQIDNRQSAIDQQATASGNVRNRNCVIARIPNLPDESSQM